jgi:hypothetical protein
MIRRIFVITLSASLLACAGNTIKSDVTCTNKNWFTVGYSTALSGQSVRTFDKYKEKCTNLEEQALSKYLDGFTKGVIEYCTFDNGYAVGSSNAENPNSCPLELRTEFTHGYNRGRADFEISISRLKAASAERERAAASGDKSFVKEPGRD